MFKEQAAAFDQIVIYREMAQAICKPAPRLRNPEAKKALQILAMRYQRLAERKQALSHGRRGHR